MRLLTGIVWWVLLATASGATYENVGPEFEVQTSGSYGLGANSSPSAAFDPLSNRWLVAWVHWHPVYNQGWNRRINARFVSADGSMGPIFQVSALTIPNAVTADQDDSPAVAYNQSTLEFMIAWSRERGTPSGTGTGFQLDNSHIVARRVKADGTFATGEFDVSPASDHWEKHPVVGANPSDPAYAWFVIWEDNRIFPVAERPYSEVVLGQFLASDGALTASIVNVGDQTGYGGYWKNQFSASLAYSPHSQRWLVSFSYGGYMRITRLSKTGALIDRFIVGEIMPGTFTGKLYRTRSLGQFF
jgi:hypothetical protein